MAIDPTPPTTSNTAALDFLLMDLTDEQKRLVTDAYYQFARGDPKGFNAQFAVLLMAHAHALRTYPHRLKKFLDTKIKTIADEISGSLSTQNQTAIANLKATLETAKTMEALAAMREDMQNAQRKDWISINEKETQLATTIHALTTSIEQASQTLTNKVQSVQSLILAYIATAAVLGFLLGGLTVFLVMHH